jgi:hypothetical protein
VITGDIIKSSKFDLRSRDLIRKKLSEISDELLSQESPFSIDLPLPIDIFQGDSWQVLITQPEKSLRIGLFIRARLRALMGLQKVDTRLSIGIGEYLPLPQKVSLGDGSAFILSGRGLQSKNKLRSLKIYFNADSEANISPSFLTSLEYLLPLLDFIASKWTAKQAEAISGTLRGWNSSKIADNWISGKIERQVASINLQSSGREVIENTISYYEKYLFE